MNIVQPTVEINSTALAEPLPKFLTKQEVAILLRVSTRTIDNMVAAADLPSVKIGRRRIFDRDAILAQLKPDK